MRKRRRILWGKVFLYLTIFTLIIGAFYTYFRTGFFNIYSYEFVGVDKQYIEPLQDRFVIFTKQKIYKFLPGNRIFTFHYKEMKDEILSTLPNASSISIRPSSLHTLKIQISYYTPLFKLDERHAITKNGITYEEINDTSKLPELSFSTTTKLNEEVLNSISDLVSKVSATIFDVQTINIDEFGDVHLKGGNSGNSEVIFSIKSDPKKIWSNLVSAIDTDPLKSKLNTNKDSLEYLDARFGNKVFFKFTNGVKTDIMPAYASTTTQTISH